MIDETQGKPLAGKIVIDATHDHGAAMPAGTGKQLLPVQPDRADDSGIQIAARKMLKNITGKREPKKSLLLFWMSPLIYAD